MLKTRFVKQFLNLARNDLNIALTKKSFFMVWASFQQIGNWICSFSPATKETRVKTNLIVSKVLMSSKCAEPQVSLKPRFPFRGQHKKKFSSCMKPRVVQVWQTFWIRFFSNFSFPDKKSWLWSGWSASWCSHSKKFCLSFLLSQVCTRFPKLLKIRLCCVFAKS